MAPVGAVPEKVGATVAVNVTAWVATTIGAEEATLIVVESILTVGVAVPVLPEKFASPGYVTVTVWVPAVSRDEVQDAVELVAPWTSATGAQRVWPVESLKLTMPVGSDVPVKAGVTVTLKVTDWLTAEGDGVVVTATVVAAWPTVCVTVAELVA